MKKKKVVSILWGISFLSFGFIYVAIATPQNTSDTTIANIEALSETENSSHPCHTAGGMCITTKPILGVHFSED